MVLAVFITVMLDLAFSSHLFETVFISRCLTSVLDLMRFFTAMLDWACFCDAEIIAMNDKDEVAIGAVPEDYPRRLPGFRPRSVGFHACSGGCVVCHLLH